MLTTLFAQSIKQTDLHNTKSPIGAISVKLKAPAEASKIIPIGSAKPQSPKAV